jgi:nucleotide-binding universal stress UspA family protein
MKIKLVRKLAEYLDGIDVSQQSEGDVFDLSRREAELLIAEGWAVPFYDAAANEVRSASIPPDLALAADRLDRRSLEQIRQVREEMEARNFEQQERRRVEDRIRDELHDEQAKTITGDD